MVSFRSLAPTGSGAITVSSNPGPPDSTAWDKTIVEGSTSFTGTTTEADVIQAPSGKTYVILGIYVAVREAGSIGGSNSFFDITHTDSSNVDIVKVVDLTGPAGATILNTGQGIFMSFDIPIVLNNQEKIRCAPKATQINMVCNAVGYEA